ncbi:hypothetical protein GJ496_003848 [Pomphorhynchus laevis]|nr:hypothetical protein GJ496_003848 [Pomphorhynchus laevis]
MDERLNHWLVGASDLFADAICSIRNYAVSLCISNSAQPKCIPARRIPLALQQTVKNELDRLIQNEIIEIVDTRKEYMLPNLDWGPYCCKNHRMELISQSAMPLEPTYGGQACQQNRRCEPDHPIMNWPIPNSPWQRVHAYFAGPVDGEMYLVMVCAMAKWLEVLKVSSTNAQSVIQAMREGFARQGLPDELIVDNGPPFQSWEFNKFLANNGTKLVNVTPYHPKSNGLGERFVGVLKQRALSHTPIGQRPLEIQQMLLSYRNTPYASTENPLHSCSTDDVYAQCLIEYVQHPRSLREKRSKRHVIWYRRHKGASWQSAEVTERSGWVSYKVANDNTSFIHYKTTDPIRVHADQLRNRVCQESELSEAVGIENAQTQCAHNDAGNSCYSTSNVGPILVESHNRRIQNDQPCQQ